MNAKVAGVDALKRKLAALPKVAREEIRVAIAKSADEIVAMAKRLVPVDQGTLRDSIGWTWGDAPKGSMVLGQVRQRGSQWSQSAARSAALREAGLAATIYAGGGEAFYARFIEFGVRGEPGQPFFFVSYRALKKRTRSRIRRSQSKAAKKVAAS